MPTATTEKNGKTRGDTRQMLIAAATDEFNERGYDGTDTNRIARRAGFAPQTFYRWFDDKTEIFIAVYEQWQQAEVGVLRGLLAKNAADARLVEACVEHHRAYLRFRRSLRQLTYESEKVRAARAASRLRQIAFLQSLKTTPSDPAVLAATLFQLERLSDALAEGELGDMDLDPSATEAALAALIRDLRQA